MKERQILMNAFSVQAVLEGRKIQTRRVIKAPGNYTHIDRLLGEWSLSSPPCQFEGGKRPWRWQGKKSPKVGDWCWELQTDVDDSATAHVRCPYGVPGDRLWVRETWACIGAEDIKPSVIAPGYTVHYKADSLEDIWCVEKWRPSIFMPRWMSRITLEVTEVRVERVQEIADKDAWDEGAWWHRYDDAAGPPLYVADGECIDCFRELWDNINKARGWGWDVNPWVFVISFKRVDILDGGVKEDVEQEE